MPVLSVVWRRHPYYTTPDSRINLPRLSPTMTAWSCWKVQGRFTYVQSGIHRLATRKHLGRTASISPRAGPLRFHSSSAYASRCEDIIIAVSTSTYGFVVLYPHLGRFLTCVFCAVRRASFLALWGVSGSKCSISSRNPDTFSLGPWVRGHWGRPGVRDYPTAWKARGHAASGPGRVHVCATS